MQIVRAGEFIPHNTKCLQTAAHALDPDGRVKPGYRVLVLIIGAEPWEIRKVESQ